MAYSAFKRNEARKIRREGSSLKEISLRFGVAKSTASLWVRDMALSDAAKNRLEEKFVDGRLNGARTRHVKVVLIENKYLDEAKNEIVKRPNYEKIICAMLYWCEGAKDPGSVAFTNSDPKLVRTFLKLLRTSFELDEKKFRPCIHLHSYHLQEKQLDFWSKITDIDKQQFIKPYRKQNGGKRIRPNYQGCISVVYHSSDLARRLHAIAKAFLYHTGA